MKKVKITYFDLGMHCMMAKIVMIYGWYDLQNQMMNNGIQESSVLKVEVIVEADPMNTEDLTEAMQ